MYDRYGNFGGFPNVTASGSPMNYGGYYPPTTYSASSTYNGPTSGPAYGGRYQAASQSFTSTAGPSYGQYATSGASGYGAGYSASGAGYTPYTSGATNPASASTSSSNGNGYTATSGASYSGSNDTAFLTAVQNLSLGN